MQNLTVGVGIVTFKDKKHLAKCIPNLLNSPLKPRIVVFNSDVNDDGTVKKTSDGTVDEAIRLGAETFLVPRSQMNHGEVRERTRKFLGTDIVVMMTPDAYPEDIHMLEKLVKPIIDGTASVAVARQTPRPDANAFVRFGRLFSYPEESHVRSLENAKKYGSCTAFTSDSCTAWSSKALDEIGGFRWILSGEDAIAGAMLIKAGHKIAYVAEAIVEHSHDYGPKKEFVRHFDTGLYRRQWAKVLDMGTGSDATRGKDFAIGMFKHLVKTDIKLIPRAFAQLALGYLGYKLGWLSYHKAPEWFYIKISPADFFWFSDGYKAGKWYQEAK